jgi:hypothetical protein
MALLDMIGAIVATGTAAIVVGSLAAVYPGSPAQRVRIIVAFTAWFVLVVLLSVFDVFDPVRGFGVPALGFAVIVPIVVLAFAALGSADRFARVSAIPMPALIAVHILRILGLQFLLLWSAGRLTAPFAPSAGWGDIITGVAAVPVAWAVWRQVPGWRSYAIVWNLFGAADLIAAIAFGTMSAPGSPLQLFAGQSEPVMTTLPWILIPAYLVPVWLSTHGLMLIELARRAPVTIGRAHRLWA